VSPDLRRVCARREAPEPFLLLRPDRLFLLGVFGILLTMFSTEPLRLRGRRLVVPYIVVLQ
jgi:hypothetical protein